jgi:hypothetical protein
MDCWFWNIDLNERPYFWSELRERRLRQGWGYDEKLDLRKLNEKRLAGLPFDDQERQAWDRCCPMLLSIHEGDLVVVKNVPTAQEFAIVKVVGGYSFMDPNDGYGHVLEVEIVNTFHKYSRIVPSPFTNALGREQNPIRVTNKHRQTVLDLASINPTAEEKDRPELFKDKVKRLRQGLLPHVVDVLKKNLTAPETERLVLAMLQRDGMDVVWNAGSGEKGADILWNVQLGYGLDSKIAIQVKMHWDGDDDTTGVEQLVLAFQSHPVQFGLLVTTARELGPNLHRRLEEAQKEHNIGVLYGGELYERLLEVIADANLDLSLNS